MVSVSDLAHVFSFAYRMRLTGLVCSQFGMFECLISAFVDEFPVLRPKKILFTALMCVVLFVLGIPCVTNVSTASSIIDHSP